MGKPSTAPRRARPTRVRGGVAALVAVLIAVAGPLAAIAPAAADVVAVPVAWMTPSPAIAGAATAPDGTTTTVGLLTNTTQFGGGTAAVTLGRSDPEGNVYAARYAPSGTLAWAVRLPGNTPYGTIARVTLTADGGAVVLAGRTQGRGMTLYRLGPKGGVQWSRIEATSAMPSSAEGTDVGVAPDGSILVTATVQGTVTFGSGADARTVTSRGERDGTLVTYRANGTLARVEQFGGAHDHTVTDLSVNAAGEVAITGMEIGDATFGSGADTTVVGTAANLNPRMYLAKFRAAGTLRWVRVSGPLGQSTARGTHALVTADGSVVGLGLFTGYDTFGAAGTVSGPATTPNAYVVRYRDDGTPQWVRQARASYGTWTGLAEASGDIVVASSGYALDLGGPGTTASTAPGGLNLLRYAPDGTVTPTTVALAASDANPTTLTADAAGGLRIAASVTAAGVPARTGPAGLLLVDGTGGLRSNLHLTFSGPPAITRPGDPQTFVTTISNTGPDPALGVTVRTLLPAGYGASTVSASVGTYNLGTWTVGDLAGGASATISLLATPGITAECQANWEVTTASASRPSETDATDDSVRVLATTVDTPNPVSGPDLPWATTSRPGWVFSSVASRPDGDLVTGGTGYGTTSIATPSGPVEVTAAGSGSDGLVVAWSPAGDVRWTQQVHSNNSSATVLSVAAAPGGDTIVVGSYRGGITIGAGAGALVLTNADGTHTDGFVTRLGPDGTPQWVTRLASVWDDELAAVALLPDGRIAVAGKVSATATLGAGPTSLSKPGNGTNEIAVALLTATGSPQWFRTAGGPKQDKATAIAIDPAGHIVVGGQLSDHATIGTTDLTIGTLGGFVAAWDQSGSVLWADALTSGHQWSALESMVATDDGVVIGGYSSDTGTLGGQSLQIPLGRQGFVARLSTSGSVLWSQVLLDSISGANGVGGVAFDPASGDVVVGATVTSTVTIGVGPTALTSTGAATYPDALLLRLAGDGTPRWIQRIRAGGEDWSFGVAIRADGNLAIVGRGSGRAQFGGTTMCLTAPTGIAGFVAVFAGTGPSSTL